MSYRRGGPLQFEPDAGWQLLEPQRPERFGHITFTLLIHPPKARLCLAFDTTNTDHMTALVDVVSHQALYLTDPATYHAVRTTPEGAEFGRAIVGFPGADAVQLQDLLSRFGLPSAN